MSAPIHEESVILRGAWLIGELDIEAAIAVHRLGLWKCHITRINARNARVKSISLEGSRLVKGMMADGLHCEDDVCLRDNFHATGEIWLVGATIGGDLNCRKALLECADGDVFVCDRAVVSGSVFLRDGFRAKGRVSLTAVTIRGDFNCRKAKFTTKVGPALDFSAATISGFVRLSEGFRAQGGVRLMGTTISGSFECSGGRFECRGGDALFFGRARIAGSVFLRTNFHAAGRVRLWGAQIGGNLDCSRALFENAGEEALGCDGIRVARLLRLQPDSRIKGGIRFADARVGSLSDDHSFWANAIGQVVLDGFTYERFVEAPTDAKSRIAWLNTQLPAHLSAKFRPQPWEQAIAVLRAMGHTEEAREVAFTKYKQMREAGRYVGGSRWWDWIYGTLVGYGYKPRRLFGLAAGIWFVGTLAYWAAVLPAWTGSGIYYLGPPKSEPNPVCLVERAISRNAQPCAAQSPRYQDFFAPTYSLEVMLPVISLGGKERWQPVVSDQQGNPLFWGHALRVFYWFQTAFGWLAGLLLVGVVGALIKKD